MKGHHGRCDDREKVHMLCARYEKMALCDVIIVSPSNSYPHFAVVECC
jgi:hypothetical protein